jgi:hypothetical protein
MVGCFIDTMTCQGNEVLMVKGKWYTPFTRSYCQAITNRLVVNGFSNRFFITPGKKLQIFPGQFDFERLILSDIGLRIN